MQSWQQYNEAANPGGPAYLECKEGVADDLAAAPSSQQGDKRQLQRIAAACSGTAAQRQAQQHQGAGPCGRHEVNNAPQDEQAGGDLGRCSVVWAGVGWRVDWRCVADRQQASYRGLTSASRNLAARTHMLLIHSGGYHSRC